jgi:hypothetical protein
MWVRELEKLGVQIEEWDGSYSHVKEAGYLPPGVGKYDLLHLNWDPQTINHYLPQHFEGAPPLSLFLHDVPPNSTCPVWDSAKLRMGYEPYPGLVQLDHAIPPFHGPFNEKLEGPIRVGVTGVRNDPGFGMVEDLCKREGWELSRPAWQTGGSWVSMEEEIARLATCTFNICWYHTSGRGKSMGAMMCAASRRPLVLSNSTMFSCLEPYQDELYQCKGDANGVNLERMAEVVLGDLEDGLEVGVGVAKVPNKLLTDLSWARCAQRIKSLWESLL